MAENISGLVGGGGWRVAGGGGRVALNPRSEVHITVTDYQPPATSHPPSVHALP